MSEPSYTRVAAHQANQMHSSRGGGQWSTSIIAADLREALGDAGLLTALAKDVKAGDRILIASYLTGQNFAAEQRDMVATLLVTSVVKPMTATDGQKRPGKVGFRILDCFLLGEKPEKLVEDRGEIEVEPAKKRRASRAREHRPARRSCLLRSPKSGRRRHSERRVIRKRSISGFRRCISAPIRNRTRKAGHRRAAVSRKSSSSAGRLHGAAPLQARRT